jgi:hypothetical protein
MDHNKLITAAAKKALASLGLRRQRKSRIWYDDHGWWAIVVEFQPSSWDRGSYLNVALSWMLYECDHWTLDICNREEGGFRSATSGDDFEAAMTDLAARAARRVLDYRERFSSLDKMCKHYDTIEGHGGWPDYYAGVLAGLHGNREAAERRLSLVLSAQAATTWHRALQFRCQDLIRFLGEPTFFRDSVLGIILRCRSGRCLEDQPVEEIMLP